MLKKSKMLLIVLCASVMALIALPSWGWLSVNWDVTTSNGLKTYTYTFTNDNEPIFLVSLVSIFMTRSGADSVINASTSTEDWGISRAVGGISSWWSAAGPLTDKTIQITLTTPDTVPTDYNGREWWYSGSTIPIGRIGSSPGDGYVPVPSVTPVPEPSSLAALGLGLLPAGMLIRKRCRLH